MSDEPQDGEFNYDLVMPFLPVASKGGPYDDDAFCAGYAMGLLDAELGGSVFGQGRAVLVQNREQADLIAMRHGFIAEFTEEQDPNWVSMTVRRAVSDPSEGIPA